MYETVSVRLVLICDVGKELVSVATYYNSWFTVHF